MLILSAGSVAYLLFRDRFAGRKWGLREWLLMAFGGLTVIVLGWTMFIPADSYYTPSIYGELNRINGLAAYGVVLLLYGSFGVVASLVGQSSRRAPLIAPVVLTVLVVGLLGAYLHVLRRHIQIWNLAYAAERAAISTTQKAFPRLASGTTVFGASYPTSEVPGVPIITATWDYAGMLRMEYDDSTLYGYPVLPELSVGCGKSAVVLKRDRVVEERARYGAVRLLNLATGEHSSPGNREACWRVASRYRSGPLYLSPSY